MLARATHIAVVGLFALSVTACQATKEDGKAHVDQIAATVKEGTSEAEIVKRFGQPDEKAATPEAKAEGNTVWVYKKIDKFYDLQIRMSNGKSTWAVAQDKSAQIFRG